MTFFALWWNPQCWRNDNYCGIISTSYANQLFHYLKVMTQLLPYCTYVLFSEKDRVLYIGYSSNLERRILQHNSGNVKSTTYRRPLKLIFCEFYLFEKDARNREQYLKTTAGKRAIKLMLRSTLQTLGYAEKVRFLFAEEETYV